MVEVSETARIAAYGAFFECYEDAPNDLWLEAMRAGKHDDDPLVQAIAQAEARGRIAGIKEAAELAVAYSKGPIAQKAHGENIATAFQSLITKDTK